MPIRSYDEVHFGDDLPETRPDIRMPTVKRFTDTVSMSFSRFNDHEKARESGLPGAIVPGIMSQGILVAMVHGWAPDAEVLKIDTIFRAPLVVDSEVRCTGVVTDMDDESRTVEVDLTILNEANETPVLGTATVKLA